MFVIKKNTQIKNTSPPAKTSTPNFNKKATIKAQWTYYDKNNHPDYNLSILDSQRLLIKTMTKTYELLKKNNIEIKLFSMSEIEQILSNLNISIIEKKSIFPFSATIIAKKKN